MATEYMPISRVHVTSSQWNPWKSWARGGFCPSLLCLPPHIDTTQQSIEKLYTSILTYIATPIPVIILSAHQSWWTDSPPGHYAPRYLFHCSKSNKHSMYFESVSPNPNQQTGVLAVLCSLFSRPTHILFFCILLYSNFIENNIKSIFSTLHLRAVQIKHKLQ